jgi:hypothetical protein
MTEAWRTREDYAPVTCNGWLMADTAHSPHRRRPRPGVRLIGLDEVSGQVVIRVVRDDGVC